jgi:ribosome-associated translation inhibitor RaiA
MAIEIQGLPVTGALRTRVLKQIGDALRPLSVAPVTARVTFVDVNGPKGGLGIRCAVTLKLPRRPAIRAETLASTPRRAFDGTFATLERQLAKYREIRSERARRPKKYFVAKRLLGAEGGTET